jgi:glyoxylase-like metal-dependent hydrolase (beta-lactamase superfamily II)
MDMDSMIKEHYDTEKLEKAFRENDPKAMPEGIFRVTAGSGGDSVLVTKYDKTLLFDTGMAYCGEKLVENIKDVLGDRGLDYVILSHTHYDHVGALPYVIKAFPEATVMGSAHGQYVLTRPGALKMMLQLGRNAEKMFGEPGQDKCIVDGMKIDKVLAEGEKVDLGGGAIQAFEAKGHTDCSMMYMLEPDHILFASESTGVVVDWDVNEVSILKSVDDSMRTLAKCRELRPERVIVPHYGITAPEYTDAMWDIFEWSAKDQVGFIGGLVDKGYGYDKCLEEFENEYWSDRRQKQQPRAAFHENAMNIVRVYMRYFGAEV